MSVQHCNREEPAQGAPTPNSDLMMVVCRFRPDQLDAVNARAAAAGVSTAESVRRLVAARLTITQSEAAS
jgi:hypothetical protein